LASLVAFLFLAPTVAGALPQAVASPARESAGESEAKPVCAVPCPASDCDDPALNLDTISDVIVILDATRSMGLPCMYHGEQRLAIALWGVYDLVDAVPEAVPLAVVRLRDDAEPLRPLEPIEAEQKTLLRRSLMLTRPTGRTELKAGFEVARRMLETKPGASPLVVLFTDGQDGQPGNAHGIVAELKRQFGDRWHFQVVGISVDESVIKSLRSLADAGAGEFAAVKSHAELPTALAGSHNLCDDVRRKRLAEAKKCHEDYRACCDEFQKQHCLLVQTQAELAECEKCKKQLQSDLEKCKAELECEQKKLADCETCREKLAEDLCESEKHVAVLERQKSTLARNLKKANAEIVSLTRELETWQRWYWFLWWCYWVTFVIFLLIALLLLLCIAALLRRNRYLFGELKTCRTDLEHCKSQNVEDAKKIHELEVEVSRLKADNGRLEHGTGMLPGPGHRARGRDRSTRRRAQGQNGRKHLAGQGSGRVQTVPVPLQTGKGRSGCSP
jgi:hypothetical protein